MVDLLFFCFAGCTGGVGRGKVIGNGVGSGGGHGGKGGLGCFNDSCVEGGISYGNANLPCELGSGSGNDTSGNSTAGGGIIGMFVPILWTDAFGTLLNIKIKSILLMYLTF